MRTDTEEKGTGGISRYFREHDGAADNLVLDEPWDYNRLPLSTQVRVVQWMEEKMK